MPITDAMFLLGEARQKPLHVGGLQVYRPPEDPDPGFARRLYRDLTDDDRVAGLFTRYPRQALGGLGPWEWVQDENLDLEYHVRHSALPHPGEIRELLALVSRLHGALLDRERPLWEMHVIEGLADGRIATYTKIHHALMDGVSAMRWLSRALSTDPDERDMPAPWAPRGSSRPATSSSEGVGGPLRALAHGAVEGGRAVVEAGGAAAQTLVEALDDRAATLPYRAPRSMLNVPITGARRYAADSWSLERIRGVGTTLGGSVNDVVLAMCSGALRRYLLDHDALPEQPLVSAVPISLRGREEDADDESAGNAVGIVLCNLATDLEQPLARFETIHASMRDNKSRMEGLSQGAIILLSALSFGPVAFGPLFRFEALRRPVANIVISNVPGPTQPLYYNGARLEGLYPVSVPYDGQALNITANTYAGSLEFGLIGCRRRVPRLQRLLGHLEDSLAELEAAA